MTARHDCPYRSKASAVAGDATPSMAAAAHDTTTVLIPITPRSSRFARDGSRPCSGRRGACIGSGGRAGNERGTAAEAPERGGRPDRSEARALRRAHALASGHRQVFRLRAPRVGLPTAASWARGSGTRGPAELARHGGASAVESARPWAEPHHTSLFAPPAAHATARGTDDGGSVPRRRAVSSAAYPQREPPCRQGPSMLDSRQTGRRYDHRSATLRKVQRPDGRPVHAARPGAGQERQGAVSA